jgi:ABC-type transport system involved in multi-copper enzyme maturation permease subunit
VTNAFRAEWVRLLRPRTMLAVAVPLVFFPAAMTVLTFAVATGDTSAGPAQHVTVTLDDLTAADGYLVGAEAAATLVGVVVMVFLAVAFGADHACGTLRNLLVREPRRARLLTGRLLALLAFIAGGLVLSIMAATVAAWVAAASYDVGTAGWSGFVTETAKAWAALVVAAIGWGTAGALLGTVLRHTASAVAAGAIWALLVESIVSEVWDSAGRWLPGALFDAAAARGTDAVSAGSAVAMAVLYAAVGYLAAVVSLNRRDVLA